jgi:hypothetical protein
VKITHFYMSQKAESWQTYRGTTQTNGKNEKPITFFPGETEMGDGILFCISAQKS